MHKGKHLPAAYADGITYAGSHTDVGQWQVDKIHFWYFAVVLGKWSPCYAQAFLQLRKQNCPEHEKHYLFTLN